MSDIIERMNDLIDYISDDNRIIILLKSITLLIAGIIALITIWLKIKRPNYQNHYDKVYLPIFRKIESHLQYNSNNTSNRSVINSIEKIIDKNYSWVYPSTIVSFKKYKEHPDDQDNALQFYKEIDKRYERLRIYLFLPRRNLQYKVDNNEAINKSTLLIHQILFFIRSMFLFLLSIIILLFFFAIVLKYFF